MTQCESCRTTFTAAHGNQVYCSVKCQNRAKYDRLERVPCRICGGPTSWIAGHKKSPATPKHNSCLSEHGTSGRYQSGCRCQPCRDSKAKEYRDYRARRRASPTILCTHQGCTRDRVAHGLCTMHLKRKQRSDGTYKPSPSDAWDAPHRLARYKTRKAILRGAIATGAHFTVSDLIERDGSDCGICGGIIPNAEYPDPLSASIDHIVPISLGGEHSSTNARATHLRCNVSRGNRTEARTSN